MLTWIPGWGQMVVPVATHLLIVVILSRQGFSAWTAVMFALLMISVLRQTRKRWQRIGSAIRISLPYGSPPYSLSSEDPGTRQVVRVIWSLPRWVTVELASPVGREVVDIFDSEMAANEWATLRRWTQLDKMLRRWTQLDKMLRRRTQLDKQRFSRRPAAGRPAGP